jgi:hypothetical protein
VGDVSMFPEQEVLALGRGVDFRWRKGADQTLAATDPIVMSELVRDIEKMFA